jgi:hypothetical protein
VEVDPGSVLESLGSARRYADPQGPRQGRLLAARGALPLPPAQIAGVLYALTLDPDAEIRDRASASLEELPDRIVDAALEGEVHPGLLAHYAERERDNEARIEKIALNAATPDETICFVATLPFPRVIDIVANNQIRLLRCPALLDALGANALTGQATIDRILHFLQIERAPGEPPPDESAEPEPTDEEPEEETAGAALLEAETVPQELVDEPEPTEDEQTEEERNRSLFALVQEMSVIQKIKLAVLGNSEARSLLARDRNRLVATAVVRSPKITEHEIVAIAHSRSVCDDVIRIIASNRQWTRNYAVQQALATNSKTPLPSAIKFLNYLTDRDLKQIMRSRDVRGPVSVQARRILTRKGKI